MKHYYKVMNAKIGAQEDLKKKDCIFEPKLDGFRALCYVNKDTALISRNNLTFYYELNVRRAIKAHTCVLDGELIAFDTKGNPSFTAFQEGYPIHYAVFDILMKNGRVLVHEPLMERKKILAQTIQQNQDISIIPFATNGPALWRSMMKHHMEGVMVKEKYAPYYMGKRSATWLKVKRHGSVDCVIVGYIQKKRIISSFALALYNQNKELVYFGNVGTGMDEPLLSKLYPKLERLKTDKLPLDAATNKKIIWVKPKFACEIKYAELTRHNKFRSPVFLRLRTDKPLSECTIKDQLPRLARRKS